MEHNAPRPSRECIRQAARLRYEATPAKLVEIAAEFGVTDRTLKRWSAAVGGWRKCGPELAEKAQAAADRVAGTVASIPVDATEARQSVLADLRERTAVELRIELLDRHRKEWVAPRALIYEAIKSKNLELARIAKTAAETLRIAQEAERRAWNLDPAEDCSSVFVIERT